MVVFVSNYLNHHQIPFCHSMYELLKGDFTFIQTEPMEEERIKMGWNQQLSFPYLRYYYQEPEKCKALILAAKVVLFGGCDDERYIEARLHAKKPVIRISERLYKTGQWKAISPRGLKKKYHDHTGYRKDQVYLLCAGAYVPSDFSIVHAYPGKMYRWGYFPETKHYDIEELLKQKGWLTDDKSSKTCVPYILWAARMIPLKHPELPIEVAKYLKNKGLDFHMEIIGGGVMEEQIKALRKEYGLEDVVTMPGFMPPEKVRESMEKADIFLFTSDREEGWGAVANESMNSGCALVADHMIGAVPYLVKHGENGLIYRDGNMAELFQQTEKLVRDPELCRKLGRQAYQTITDRWNAETAAARLIRLSCQLGILDSDSVIPGLPDEIPEDEGPCTPAPVTAERKMYGQLTASNN